MKIKYIVPLPEGIQEVQPKPVVISGSKKILMISDLHIPYQSNKAVETAINYRDDFDTILILGDLLDMYQCSRFTKNPAAQNVMKEIGLARQFLESLRKKFPKSRIIFLEGNHDERLRHYVWVNAPALSGLKELELRSLLKVSDYGIEYYENGTRLKLGGLFAVHGNEIKGSGGINTAWNVARRTLDNTICGHFHTVQRYAARSVSDKEFAVWTMGCLCQLRPKFAPMSNHQWGFAFVEISGKTFRVENKQILTNYEIV